MQLITYNSKHFIQKTRNYISKVTGYKLQATNSVKGFSLVELLVVITIVGILSAGGLVLYTSFNKQSRDARRKGDLEQIRAAVEIYRSNNGVYPSSITVGSSLCDPSDDGGCATNKYMEKVPNDPDSARYTYTYTSTAPYTDYTLGAHLDTAQTSCSDAIACDTDGKITCEFCVGPYGEKTSSSSDDDVGPGSGSGEGDLNNGLGNN